MKRLFMALALVATVLFPSTASAHHTTWVTVDPNCSVRDSVTSVDYIDFSGGHYIHLTVDDNGVITEEDSPALNGSGTWQATAVTLTGYSGTIKATAQAKYPNGADENQPVTTTVTYDCPKPPKRVHDITAEILGPCGDPMHGAKVWNRGDYREIVYFHFYKYGRGWVTRVFSVAPHSTHWTGWKHVLGKTWMTVRTATKVLDHERSAPAGNYRACNT